jgi:hypothetical protein
MYLVVAIVTTIVNRRLSPSEAFSKFVCRPIPKSVSDIKMDRLIRWQGWHRYIFHFKIDKADLSSILNSWPFQEIRYFRYNPSNGILEWAKGDLSDYSQNLQPTPWMQFSMHLYNTSSGDTEPEWFNIENWDSPKVYLYVVKDVYRLRFLVYNNKLGEACFIDYRSPD